jgi:hypothetical protein
MCCAAGRRTQTNGGTTKNNVKDEKGSGHKEYGIIFVSGEINSSTVESVCREIIEYNIKAEVAQIRRNSIVPRWHVRARCQSRPLSWQQAVLHGLWRGPPQTQAPHNLQPCAALVKCGCARAGQTREDRCHRSALRDRAVQGGRVGSPIVPCTDAHVLIHTADLVQAKHRAGVL